MSEPWFGVKTYGIGITPKNLAGWVSTVVYGVLILSVPLVERALTWPLWIMPVAYVVLTAAFLALLLIKGDGKPWRWRWGHD